MCYNLFLESNVGKKCPSFRLFELLKSLQTMLFQTFPFLGYISSLELEIFGTLAMNLGSGFSFWVTSD
jgi:hypothetical protein